jgi:predicted transcriptional regulator
MEIHAALEKAMTAAGWTVTEVAVAAGLTESAIRKTLNGGGMRADSYQRLRKELPGFAELVDGKVVA